MIRAIKTLLCLLSILNLGYANTINKSFDIRQKTSLTEEHLDSILKGKLENTGKFFKKAEENYNINANFLVAIALVESAHGTSNMIIKRNNAFGLKGKSFNSVEECINYTGKLISDENGYYYGRNKYTIDKISKVYAPNYDGKNNYKWSNMVIHKMKQAEKLLSISNDIK